jgi:hypothetical protein
VNRLKIIYKKWLIESRKLLDANPFAQVREPKTDKIEPRLVTDSEVKHFLDPLPIAELASLPRQQFYEGHVVVDADTAKDRKTRRCKLPDALYHEVVGIAGRYWVWESFTDELADLHRRRGRQDHAASIHGFRPAQMVAWIEDQQQQCFDANPSIKRFKLHNLRGRTMSRAKELGVSCDQAAIAFGRHSETMRRLFTVSRTKP